MSTGGRLSRFRAPTATEAIGSLKLKRLTGDCGAIAKSLDRSRHQRRLRWLRWQGSQLGAMPSNRRRCHKTGQSRALRVQSQTRPRRYLDEPLLPLDLPHFQLACRSQRHPYRRHRCLLRSRTWLSFRTRRRGLEHLQLAPLFSLACGCAPRRRLQVKSNNRSKSEKHDAVCMLSASNSRRAPQ